MKVKQNDMVMFNVIEEGEYGLLNPMTRNLHRLNDTGKFIWEACSEARPIEELARMVADEFHIPAETAQQDVEEFVDRMVRFQLLEEL
jgi:hypothetical protein